MAKEEEAPATALRKPKGSLLLAFLAHCGSIAWSREHTKKGCCIVKLTVGGLQRKGA